MTYSGPDVPAKTEAMVRLREGTGFHPGDPVYRLTDALQLKRAMDAPLRRIPVDFELEAFPNRKLRLQAGDGARKICLEGDFCEEARNREMTGEEMEKQLRKTGGTDFEVRKVTVHTAGTYVPLSRINELRRKTLERLAEQRTEDFAYPADRRNQTLGECQPGNASGPVHFSTGAGEKYDKKPDFLNRLLVTVRDADQAEACREKDTLIAWYPEDFRQEALERTMNAMESGDWLRLPEVCEENTLEEIHRAVSRQSDRLGGVMLGSVGQMGLSWPVPVGAGPGIPVMNREAALLLREEGCVFVTASPELTGEELKILTAPAEDLPPVILQVYGRTQLMLLHHCPARTAQGWSQGREACRLCDDRHPQALRGKVLEDERGYRFPLMRLRLPEGCLVRLMNALPTNLADQRGGVPRMLEMTGETPEEASGILQQVREYRRTGESTRGHWSRAVL